MCGSLNVAVKVYINYSFFYIYYHYGPIRGGLAWLS